ncbi:hypothetical protein RF11_13331 [Thelohanellus kitauei]|uniref:Uncharacterized protein n=1 Tax=Thelohanellus kitauei TaxID=669202 RepID=A0A0C2JY38_THEKT|nr:hypothetical protein RF11_13331 [Thelohanellus kitauei]
MSSFFSPSAYKSCIVKAKVLLIDFSFKNVYISPVAGNIPKDGSIFAIRLTTRRAAGKSGSVKRVIFASATTEISPYPATTFLIPYARLIEKDQSTKVSGKEDIILVLALYSVLSPTEYMDVMYFEKNLNSTDCPRRKRTV